MKLPHPERAVIDEQKLVGYCLNSNHAEGRHKAQVFQSALGFGLNEAEELKASLLQAVQLHQSIPTKANQHGQKYTIDFAIARLGKQAVIRSVWIVRFEEDFPRLITCYVL